LELPARYPATYQLKNGTALVLLEAVRHLPARRLVCRGEWEGQAVYAKLFFGSRASRDAERDAAGALALMAVGIDTPPLLSRSTIPEQGARVLIYAAITDARNAEELLTQLASPEARGQLAERVASAIAEHHAHGLMQCDMYLKNFLVSKEIIYTLDGDGIRPLPKFRPRRAALDNLATMLSKFDVEDDGQIPQVYAAYCQGLGKNVTPSDTRLLQRLVTKQRRRAVQRYADSKVFRNCTDIAVEHAFRHFYAIVRQPVQPELLARLRQPSGWFDSPNLRFLKRGNTCTVAAEHLDGRDVVIKRYNIRGWLHALERAWRPSRAAHSWSAAHRLRMYGIATPAPLALFEWRKGPLRAGAFFIAEEVRAPDAKQYFADPDVSQHDKAVVAERIARLLAKLQRLGIVHGDLKANNIKITSSLEPVLIDLDALSEPGCNWLAERGHIRDLKRWMRNWQGNANVEMLMREALTRIYRDEAMLLKAGVIPGKK
jgi:tRNA A-37 threonylcarbamoyl transferase component Bud32